MDSSLTVKITDFGSSRELARAENMTTKIGTGAFMAPEIVLGEFYDEKVDVYSFGIILFVLIAEENKIYDCMNAEMRVARVCAILALSLHLESTFSSHFQRKRRNYATPSTSNQNDATMLEPRPSGSSFV